MESSFHLSGLTLKMNDHDEQQYDNGFRDQLCKLKLSNRELKETITELQQQVKNKCREIAYLKSLVANPRRNQRTKSVSIVESAAITEMPSKVTTFVQTNTTSSENDATVSEISKSFKMRFVYLFYSIF